LSAPPEEGREEALFEETALLEEGAAFGGKVFRSASGVVFSGGIFTGGMIPLLLGDEMGHKSEVDFGDATSNFSKSDLMRDGELPNAAAPVVTPPATPPATAATAAAAAPGIVFAKLWSEGGRGGIFGGEGVSKRLELDS
jgi:hypothetical protein